MGVVPLGGLSTAQTVHGLGPGGPQPSSRNEVPCYETDGPRLVARRSTSARGWWRSPMAPGSRLLGGTHQGEEMLGFLLGSTGHPRSL
jgi:hypothetical protein